MSRIFASVSGGLDSVVMLYKLIADGHEVRPTWFHYGQRHDKETQAAFKIAGQLSNAGRIPGFNGVDLESLFGNFLTAAQVANTMNAGALLGQGDIPDGHYTADVMKATIVPNRNMIFTSVLVGLAVARGYDTVALAVHTGDHAIYPDCRPEFWDAMGSAVNLGNGIDVIRPFVHMTKADIVALGVHLHVPFEETWSCYKGQELHCGTCGTCVERREAFQLVGVVDPTRYACDVGRGLCM